LKNNENIFLDLLAKNAEKLWRFILSFENDKDIAKDIYSETIAVAWVNFSKLREHDAFLSFIFTVARRIRLYQKQRYEKIYIDCDIDFSELIAAKINTDDKLLVDDLYKALNKLPDKQKEAIILFHIYGFSRKETAKIQGTSEYNVKVRLSRGKKLLKQILGADND